VNVLVTGGAGFIGSHLVERLIEQGHSVVVLDNLVTGLRENVHHSARFIEGDIIDSEAVARAMNGVEIIFHEAAYRSVTQSIDDPLSTDRANVEGTLTVLKQAAGRGVRRVIYASSSSVYGGTAPVPTPEDASLSPRSPYAVTKLIAEQYLRVFAEIFGLQTIALRYFNVYGPRQRSDSPYAAVIPRFVQCLSVGGRPTVHGDGHQSRDFTFVSDVVDANLSAAATPSNICDGRAFNVSGGEPQSILDLLALLGQLSDVEPDPVFAAPRQGDIRHSGADLAAARRDLGYVPKVTFHDGLARTLEERDVNGR